MKQIFFILLIASSLFSQNEFKSLRYGELKEKLSQSVYDSLTKTDTWTTFDTLYWATYEMELYQKQQQNLKHNNIDNLYYNYIAKQIDYYTNVSERDVGGLIPQNETALETYKWYRKVKKYTIRKSIKLTIKNWKLNSK